MTTSRDLIEQLKAKRGLPTPPGVALRMLDLIRDGSGSAGDIAEILGSDPVLTSRVLNFANSPLFGSTGTVSSLSRAVALLGMRRVAVLALSYCFVDACKDTACESFDRDLFWQESIARAVMARETVKQLNRAESEEAFVAGLVSDMGRLLMATGLPEEYEQVLAASNSQTSHQMMNQLELEKLGQTSEDLGVSLLREWNFPADFVDNVIEAQRIRDGEAPSSEELIPRGLAIAHMASQTIVLPPNALSIDLLDRIIDLVGMCLGLDQDGWEECFATCVEEWKMQCAVLDVTSHDVKSFGEIETDAREQLAMLSIAAVAESEEMFTRATTDTLTGIPNRAAMNDRLNLEVERFRRDGGDLLFLIADVDHFKQFNDTHGHLLGDKVLHHVAQTMNENTRRVDMIARYGGEEFGVIAYGCSRAHAYTMADRLRKVLSETPLEYEGQTLDVTISIGGAFARMAGCAEAIINDLISRADAQLYAAKQAGRNRTLIDPADVSSEAPA